VADLAGLSSSQHVLATVACWIDYFMADTEYIWISVIHELGSELVALELGLEQAAHWLLA